MNSKKTIKDALNLGSANSFVKKELISYLSGINFDEIYLNLEQNFEYFDEYELLLDRFLGGEPLQYITQRADFWGREFYVEKGVLIPREETEILVEKTIKIAKNFKNPKICEIGFGSGVISISLEKELPNAQIIASDISQTALKVASINAKKFNSKVKFVFSDLLDEIKGDFDIIVSNPPYIASDYALDIWVANEPKTALFGGEKGDEILKQIINLAKFKAKFLLCEMGYDQKNSLSTYLADLGFEAEFYQDLAGFDRGFVAKNLEFA